MITYNGFRLGDRPYVARSVWLSRPGRAGLVAQGGSLRPATHVLHVGSSLGWGDDPRPWHQQLAVALLADCLGADLARRYYLEVAEQIVASFDHDGWQLSAAQLEERLAELGVLEPSATSWIGGPQ